MRSTFGSMNIAVTGLNIAQRQLDVTSHNISNANVQGYSRQRYINSAMPAQGYRVQFTSPLRGKEGLGVESLSLDQIRDVFLDRQFRNEQTKATYWETRSGAMYYVEDVFNSIDANSLDGVMASFFSALQELSKNATDEAIRTNVVAQAKRMVDVIQTYDRQLTDLMEQQNFMLLEQVRHTNRLLTQMAALNENIFRFEMGGSIANDLRDKRALILDELASLMDISYEYVPFEPDPIYNIYGIELTQLKVYAGGFVGENYEDNLLVQHLEAFHLEVEEMADGDNEYYDAMKDRAGGDIDPPFSHVYLASGVRLTAYDERIGDGVAGYYGGQLQSYIDIRDGRVDEDGTERIGIPSFLRELDRMVENFVREFNDIHSEGYTMPYGGNTTGNSGGDFFVGDTARSMGLADAILESAFNVAASSATVTLDALGHAQTGNNEIALELIQRMKNGVIDGLDNSIEGFYKNFLGLVASEANASNSMRTSQEILLHGIHTQRTAVSSVSEDEEMTNLIRFQHAYNAASRAITTIDEMLDKLINGTGRVGL
ncbi:MAG: flagellar hook-associated protein FlgK [Oscillospiraceae bacterium]|nr:flagellar hook-associated protein FlgK [Oscillospiraceae bacterium]